MDFRGVLFDAGGTLIQPVGGRWNPRYDFETITLRHLPQLFASSTTGPWAAACADGPWTTASAAGLWTAAFAAGQRMLDAASGTADRTEYHREILRALGVDRPPAALLAELVAPAAGPPVEAYPEVRAVLDRLRAHGVAMAVVSDSWPELVDLFRQLNLHEYFPTIVISAVLGCRKPDPRMYRAGSDGVGLPPPECLFVDDDPALVAAAINLGYGGVTITRGDDPPHDTPWITTLDELLPILGL